MDGVDMDLVNMMMLQLEDELFLHLPPPAVDMATNSVPAPETKETQSVQSRPSKRQKKERTSTSKEQRSIAARHRRERINERIRVLQRMVPGGTKMDTASVLGEAVQYVKFLKDQVQMLEMAAAEMAAAELAAEGSARRSSLMAEPWLYSSQPQAADLWSGSGEAFCMADVYQQSYDQQQHMNTL